MDTRVLTAHVPVDLAEQVDAYAERLERSRGWIVKQALSAWIEWEERKRQMTLEGLAAVDAGDVIDDADLDEWFESLAEGKPLPIPGQ
jgi:predicted transcriptional regulator